MLEKEFTTLRKYINRYCFRPTPFGLFSSVTLPNWTRAQPAKRQTEGFDVHVSTSMTVQNLFSVHLAEHEAKAEAKFTGSPSIYPLQNEYRFLRTSLNEQGKHRDYHLQSIAFSTLLKDLIARCSSDCTRREIAEHISKLAACTIAEGEDYAEFLIDAQLLVSDRRLLLLEQTR